MNLTPDILRSYGFAPAATFKLDGRMDTPIRTGPGVYAFVASGQFAFYVGRALRCLRGRLAGYWRPGRSQSTNLRLNADISERLHLIGQSIEAWTANPADLTDPVTGYVIVGSGAAVLEMALIQQYGLAANKQGRKK